MEGTEYEGRKFAGKRVSWDAGEKDWNCLLGISYLHHCFRPKKLFPTKQDRNQQWFFRRVSHRLLTWSPQQGIDFHIFEWFSFISRVMFPLQLCGVSILRAGETMEPALESVVKDIRVGKILIQTNEYTSEPEVGIFHSNYMENNWELENENQISCFYRSF